jgi:hypothetical protein
LSADEPSLLTRLWSGLSRFPALPLAAAAAVALTVIVWNRQPPNTGNGVGSVQPTEGSLAAPGVQAGLPAEVAASIPEGTLEEIAELEELNSLLAIYDISILDDQELASLLF